jgi:hypothetical protein
MQFQLALQSWPHEDPYASGTCMRNLDGTCWVCVFATSFVKNLCWHAAGLGTCKLICKCMGLHNGGGGGPQGGPQKDRAVVTSA